MNEKREAELIAHIGQYRAAATLQAISLILGLIAALWHGVAAVLVGLFGAWVFHLAKPSPKSELDRYSRRD